MLAAGGHHMSRMPLMNHPTFSALSRNRHHRIQVGYRRRLVLTYKERFFKLCRITQLG